MMQTRKVLTIKEVATALGCCEASVRRAVRRGDLRAIRLSPRGTMYIPADALEGTLQKAGA